MPTLENEQGIISEREKDNGSHEIYKGSSLDAPFACVPSPS